MLGGRLADRVGRRRVFLTGVAAFTLASFLGGLAPAGSVLIGARALQGLGAALAGPAGLSILTTTFAEGPERNRALGVWSAVLASGGAVGMLAGGLLTRYLSWRWVLFVNVPVGALILAATPRLVPAYPAQLRARIDVAGASTITAGLTALVYSTSQVPERGWTAPLTLGTFLAAVVLLGAFLPIEAYHPAPLVPLSIFRHRSLVAADAVALLGSAAIIASPIFFLTLYLQQILGFSAIQAGLATLPLALSGVCWDPASPHAHQPGWPETPVGWRASAGWGQSDAACPHPHRRELPRRRGRPDHAARPGDGVELCAADPLVGPDGTHHITPVGMWSVDPTAGLSRSRGTTSPPPRSSATSPAPAAPQS